MDSIIDGDFCGAQTSNLVEKENLEDFLSTWRRTGDALKDYLCLYETGALYDCTFRVQSEEKSHQAVFKCHKLILSAASGVFQRMLHGYFEESTKGPDDEIFLDKTSPQAFDAAMRFIYGREKNFGNTILAIQVYRFGHLWEIESLMTAVDQFLENPSTNDVCQIHDMYTILNNTSGNFQKCMEVIRMNTLEVLKSGSWLSVSLQTVVNVLSQDILCLGQESDLVEPLVQWGNALLKRNKEESSCELRKVIDVPLKLIRFQSMTQKEFCELCLTILKDVLSVEEKYAILLSISMSSSEHLPAGFCGKPGRANFNATILDLNTAYTHNNITQNYILFSTSQNTFILGLKFILFDHYDPSFKPSATFQLLDENETQIGIGNTDKKDLERDFYRFEKPVLLQANVKTKLCVTMPTINSYYTQQNFGTLMFKLGNSTSVQLHSSQSSAGVGALVFADMKL